MADYLKTEALKDIADAFESTTKVLINHSKRIEALEGNVDDLFDLASRSVKAAAKVSKRPNKRLLIVAVGVGVYVGYRFAQKDINERKTQWEQVLRNKQPANTAQSAENGTDGDAPQS